ncbi:MAG: SCO family protein [Xanthobacteraceae bacterium]|nr:MAG: SCO family protein [Xanthobacteraceae bacterium]
MARSRALVVIAAFAASLALVLGLVVWLVGGDRSGGAAKAMIGGPFQLVDQTGETVTERDLKGRPSLLFFGFTHCPDVCPTTLFEVSELLRALGPEADKVGAYFISVDPERDTPAVMKDYLASFDPHLKGLSGSAEATARMLTAYRVYAKKVPLESGGYTMDHTALVYLIGRDGNFVAPFSLKRRPDEAAAELRRHL